MSKQTFSTFFTDNLIKDWDFNNFYSYLLIKDATVSESQAIDEYKNNLERICQSSSMTRESRSRAGQILSSLKKNKRKTSTPKSTVIINNYGQTVNNKNVSGTMSVNVYAGQEEAKKQKINHVEDANSWKIDDEEDLWDAWRQFMECCCCHDFCLEKYHVIECGYSIKCKPMVTQQLLNHLDIGYTTIASPFKQYETYSFSVLEALKKLPKSCQGARKAVVSVDNDSDDEDSNQEVREFLQDFFLHMIDLLKRKDVAALLSLSEANYNLFVLWPLMSLAAGELQFVAGEYVLRSSKEEYKADACILDDQKNEVCLLETSNGFLCGDKSKYGFDHVKGTFGALAMFGAAFKKYNRASHEVAQQLNILFVHARCDSIHLWSLELCSKKVYALKKIYVVKTPTSSSSSSHVLALGNLVWKMKTIMKKSACVLEKMRKSHEENTTKMMMGATCSFDLLEYVNVDIQRPEKGAGYGILLPEEKEEEEIVVKYV
ncbi:hypothetical protein EDC96DRAFT_306210 [Choanephora cucurbitarum]|nr:hypothetical protein EDC96DRAFT_306210 [Choanephora cucurbitarum]